MRSWTDFLKAQLDTSQCPDAGGATKTGSFHPCRDLDAEGGVRSWTDFLKAQLDPASVRLLPGLWQGAAEFTGFGAGAGVLARDEACEEAVDALRMVAEECDRLQVGA